MSHHEKQRCDAIVAGKTARACDGCARRRARWYCAADDAFLCQTCDSSVHSANPLARRHRRLRLKSSSGSFGAAALDGDDEEEGFDVPTWLRGFKRKARTPRQGKKEVAAPRPPDLTDTSPSIEEEQLLYCVPVFDPSLAELRSASPEIDEAKPLATSDGSTPASASTFETTDRFAAYLPSDVELAEFAANMESLLGEASVDDSAFSMEKLGPLDSAAMRCNNNATEELKTEQTEEAEQYCPVVVDLDIDMTRESLELDFNWPGSSSTAEEDEFEEDRTEETKTAKLRLDYEAVISAWAVHGSSPWTDGERPQINLENCWNDYTGGAWGDPQLMGSGGRGQVVVDEGRQARVSRYREKRRTRLFAKKIRYEVRKLNAEKRPRMKGRFVKRAPGSAVAAFLH